MPFDPASWLIGALEALILKVLVEGQNNLHGVFAQVLFTTSDLTRPLPAERIGSVLRNIPPLIGNPVVHQFNVLARRVAESLLVIVLVYASFRSMWERRIMTHYSLRTLLPRLLGVAVLIEFSDRFCQMAIDLCNALTLTVLKYAVVLDETNLPGTDLVQQVVAAAARGPVELFILVMAVTVELLLMVLAVSYIIRYALLCALVASSPLAALASVLPETRQWSHQWTRLFSSTLFMQPAQMFLLKMGTALTLGQHNPTLDALAGLATLSLVLKVPGALRASGQTATRAHQLISHAEMAVKHLMPAAPRSHAAVHPPTPHPPAPRPPAPTPAPRTLRP